MRTGSQTATTTTYPIDVGTGGSGGLYPFLTIGSVRHLQVECHNLDHQLKHI